MALSLEQVVSRVETGKQERAYLSPVPGDCRFIQVEQTNNSAVNQRPRLRLKPRHIKVETFTHPVQLNDRVVFSRKDCGTPSFVLWAALVNFPKIAVCSDPSVRQMAVGIYRTSDQSWRALSVR